MIRVKIDYSQKQAGQKVDPFNLLPIPTLEEVEEILNGSNEKEEQA
jgi:hypothetical protein